MIKIGVLGAGHLGMVHLKLLSKMKQFELVGFYNSNRAKARKVAEELEIWNFSTPEALINASEAVVIVTPSNTHFEYAVMTLRKSKDVFIEKPLTSTLQEAKKLVELA